jgi:hypothetical protein
MTVEAQKFSDSRSVTPSDQTLAPIVEDPATTLKAHLAQKAKNSADMKHGVSFNTHELFHGTPELFPGTTSQSTPHFNLKGTSSVFGGSTVLDLGNGFVPGHINWGDRSGTQIGTQIGTPFGGAGQKELPVSAEQSGKNTRELQILRQYFQNGDMTSARSNFEKGNTDRQLSLKDNIYQNSVHSDKPEPTDANKSHESADQTKAKDSPKSGKAGDTQSAPVSGTTVPEIKGTTTVDSNGTKTTSYKDGSVRVEKTDGSGYTLTPKSDGTFVEHKWAKAPEHFWQHDVNKDPDRVLTADQAMKERHDQLVADARSHIHDKKELDKFEADLTKLEQRAKKDGVSPAQLAQMYGSVDTLITSTATTPSDQGQRLQLAEQIMSQAADPTRFHQGGQNTCGAADLEFATYLKHPEAAARMVSDVALTGQYTALDGTTFKVDPQPHGESKLPDNGTNRSHASEIFQVATVNIALKEYAKTADNVADIQYSHYWQTDDGENFEGKLRGQKPVKDTGALLNPDELPPAYSAITGDSSLGSMFQDKGAKPGDAQGGVTPFASEEQLNDYLSHAKFPVTVLVNADSEPFDDPLLGADGKYLDRDARGHWLVITGYEPGPPPKVKAFNTQGADQPMGQGGEISIHDLYKATLKRDDSIKELQKDIADEKKHGQVDTEKELELVRLEIEAGKLSKKDAQRQVKAIISHMAPEEQQKDSMLISRIAQSLGIDDVFKFAPALAQ